MVSIFYSSKQSLIPSFLYSSPNSFSLNRLLNANNPAFAVSHSTKLDAPAASSSPSIKMRLFMIPSSNEPGKKIEMYSPQFYLACTVGGILSCGLTHIAVTPLDLVKCNMQDKNYGKRCNCLIGSPGMEESPCFWAFNG